MVFLGKNPRYRDRRIVFFILVIVILLVFLPKHKFLCINNTNSLPLGIYILSNETIELGKYVVFTKPDNLKDIKRDWLIDNALFLKQITAIPGDTVCIKNNTVLINGKTAGTVKAVDRNGEELPGSLKKICGRLKKGEFWTATNHPNSFDSRYYGPIKLEKLRTVKPILLF